MSKKGKLTQYAKRRNIKKSGEPKPEIKEKKVPLFVIQKHAARSLHYDFRLSIDGVLVSWAVPKGLSMNPAQKRLAVRTDDHPIAYAKFEGVIPEGEYGAGIVMVWDKGTYRNLKKERYIMSQCLKRGRIEVFLKGEKINGGFALVKMKQKDQWLLIKMRDEFASARANPVNTKTKSVKTGRTMHQITKQDS